ncbi:sec-independent protein translocase protein TatA [Nocardioides terrae]|uniref:Sec-independent protein translocase protein TatA n=1 Tax=Nocardioides terrae TaxID=574651 RepID=A0A1I1JR00_9ACTN|nr:Sec-independent protein translocase subunit TatA [Nocardioides terrae]SFC47800.1 sec-independent protein translocase protein TatA [Nocardioides terrae]
MTSLLIGGLGTTELVLILLVVVLLFGATKLPELARGSGRALRIFKAETKGLMDDDEAATTPETQRAAELASKQAELDAKQAELDAERDRLHRGDA